MPTPPDKPIRPGDEENPDIVTTAARSAQPAAKPTKKPAAKKRPNKRGR